MNQYELPRSAPLHAYVHRVYRVYRVYRGLELRLGQDPSREHEFGLVAKPLDFQPCSDSGLTEPTMRLDTSAAQNLMDDLWQCGLRPSGAIASTGQIEALTSHLKDMREIAMAYVMPRVEVTADGHMLPIQVQVPRKP